MNGTAERRRVPLVDFSGLGLGLVSIPAAVLLFGTLLVGTTSRHSGAAER